MPPVVLLVVLGFLCFYMKFEIVFLICVKDCVGMLMGIVLNLQIYFGNVVV